MIKTPTDRGCHEGNNKASASIRLVDATCNDAQANSTSLEEVVFESTSPERGDNHEYTGDEEEDAS